MAFALENSNFAFFGINIENIRFFQEFPFSDDKKQSFMVLRYLRSLSGSVGTIDDEKLMDIFLANKSIDTSRLSALFFFPLYFFCA